MVQVVSVLGTQGNTDGTSRINLDQPQADGLFEPVADAAGHVLHAFERSVLDPHQKLVTPQARPASPFAHAPAHMKRNGLHPTIAHKMAAMVVDLLEIFQLPERLEKIRVGKECLSMRRFRWAQ